MVNAQLRAAIYVRLSSYAGTGDTSVSPETQRRACEEYARSQGWEVVATYSDLNVSGGTTKRPELAKLREQWSRYDVALALKLDRWSRSVLDFHELYKEANAHGVALVAVRDKIDMTSANGRLFANILAAFAEFEREVIRERTAAGKATLRAMGRWEGSRVPFGFKPERGELVVEPQQAAIIREAAERRADGASWRELTRWLSGQFPARKWQPRSARLVLTNERLRGTVFTAAEYEAVLKLCAPMERAAWAPNLSRLLSGMMRCAACGSKLSAQSRSTGATVYRCTLPGCTARSSVSSALIEPYVEQEYLDTFGNRQESRVRPQADLNDERAAELEAELRTISAQLADADDDAALALISRRREARGEIDRLRSMPRGPLIFVSTGRTMGEAWAAADVDGRRRLLQRALPNGITVLPADAPGQRRLNPERIRPCPLFGDVD